MKNSRPTEIAQSVLTRLGLGTQDRFEIDGDSVFQNFFARFIAALGDDETAFVDGKLKVENNTLEGELIGVTDEWVVYGVTSTQREANAVDRTETSVRMFRTSSLEEIEVLQAPPLDDETAGEWPRRLTLWLRFPSLVVDLPAGRQYGDSETARLLDRLRVAGKS